MLIIAVVVSVTIGITKAKLNNIVSYTYYNAYSTLRSVSAEMLSDFAPNDEKYMANNFISVLFGLILLIRQIILTQIRSRLIDGGVNVRAGNGVTGY